MKIQIVNAPKNPIDLIIGSARSCYSKEIVTPEKTADWEKKYSLMEDLFLSGHHTTFQHINFTFLIEDISRLAVQNLLHSHFFYNSEQISQRFVSMNVSKTHNPTNNKFISEYYEKSFQIYDELTQYLEPIMYENLPRSNKKSAKKKAIELARYVLPMGTTAHLYHTVSFLTVLSYVSYGLKSNNSEYIEFAEKIQDEVLKIEPKLKNIFELAKKYNFSYFDNLVKSGDFLQKTENIFGETLNYELSLSAHAQNQRHRTSKFNTNLIKKYYIPDELKNNQIYLKFLEENREILKSTKNNYLYLNANLIEINEFVDNLSFEKKAENRLCLNAQTEIREVTTELVKNKNSSAVPPCVPRDRNKIRPFCPEGDRYCGIPVWMDYR
jgi:flavin-dependent thymidylate synthase